MPRNPRNIDRDDPNRLSCRNCRVVYLATDEEACDDFCSEECCEEFESDQEAGAFDFQDDDLIDGVGFAHPGENSALRAATASNPRNLPCPECGCANRLTPLDVARHYVCDPCADRAERGGY